MLHRFCKEKVIELHSTTSTLLETGFGCLVSSCMQTFLFFPLKKNLVSLTKYILQRPSAIACFIALDMRWILIGSEFRPLMIFHFMSGCELGRKDFAIGKIFFLSFANKNNVFVVHTIINKIFFRCKVYLDAYIFIDTNDKLNISRWSRMS